MRDFIVRIADDPMVDVAGERMEKAGLIGIFFQKTLKALETVCEGAEVGFITITMEDVDLATADALAGIPECLVLDEPTAMLDPSSRKEVINIVKELNQKEGMTIILITHHTDEVVDADRIILMKDGKIIGDDTPKKIFADHSLLKKCENGYSAGCRN